MKSDLCETQVSFLFLPFIGFICLPWKSLELYNHKKLLDYIQTPDLSIHKNCWIKRRKELQSKASRAKSRKQHNKRKPHNIDTLSTSITPIKLWMITLICSYFSFYSIISSERTIFRLWKYRPWTAFIFSCDWTERPHTSC